MARTNMRCTPWALWILLALCGCPETTPVPANNGVANNDGPTTTTGPTTGGPANNPQALAEVVFRLEREELGLFGATKPDDRLDVALDYVPEEEAWVGTLEWPPGMYQALLMADGEEAGPFGDGDSGFAVQPIPGMLRFGPSFNPAPRQVRVRVSGTLEDPQLAVEDVAPEPSASRDTAVALRAGGEWFDEQITHWDGEDAGARVVELMDAIRERGGPIHTEYGVLFIAPARDDEAPPQIRGTWNDWQADPRAELRRVGPSLWARYVEVPEGRHEYKIVYGDGASWQTDRSNPHVAWDGIDPGTVGAFNSVLAPAIGANGRLVWLPDIHSPQLDNARDVFVYLPAAYDEDAEARFPVLYVHDGNESIVRGRFHQVADAVAGAAPAMLVFVALPTQEVRIAEYTMGTEGARGDDYVRFLADTLVPMIDGAFRTRAERGARGLAGASLGGLISFWGAMQRPEMFGYVAGMSSSFFWGEGFVPKALEMRGCQDVRYYLDSGSPDDNFEVTVEVRDLLQNMGCDFHYVLEEGGEHDWSYWNGRFDGVLDHFASLDGG